MVRRNFKEVFVESLDDGRALVTGGCLNASLAWTPANDIICKLDGDTYVSLQSTDYGLAAICGVPLRNNSFLEDLASRRRLACGVRIDELIREYADLNNAKQYKLREERAKLRNSHADRMPATIEIMVDGAPGGKLLVKFEADDRKSISVQLDGTILTFITDRCRSGAGNSNARKKLRKVDRFQFQYPEIRMNSSRQTPYVNYKDVDGVMRYRSVQPRKFDPDDEGDKEAALNEAAMELHTFYAENHNKGVGDEDDVARLGDGGDDDGDDGGDGGA